MGLERREPYFEAVYHIDRDAALELIGAALGPGTIIVEGLHPSSRRGLERPWGAR